LTPATFTKVAKLAQHRRDQRRDRIGVGHVAGDRPDGPFAVAEVVGRLLQRGSLAAGDDDLGVALGKARRDRPADAPAGARHQHHLVAYREKLVSHVCVRTL
jgi:hypothetical protein